MKELKKYDADQIADFETDTYLIQASRLRVNRFVVLKGRPCLIEVVSCSTEGKHRHSKCLVRGHGVFDGEKYEDVFPSTSSVQVPSVSRKDYELVSIDDGFLTLRDLARGNKRKDIRLPEGKLGWEIMRRFNNDETFMVTTVKAMGKEKVAPFQHFINY